MKIDIIGVPIDLGADRRGVDMGPSAIRYAHLHRKLEEMGCALEDKGNIEVPIQETCSITDPNLNTLIASSRWDGAWAARWRHPFKQVIFRLCWVAITASRLDQFVARPNTKNSV